MTEFTFIFMLYNLDTNSFGSMEGSNAKEVFEQIMGTEIPKGARFILVEHCLKSTGPVGKTYTNTLIHEVVYDADKSKNVLSEMPSYNLGARNIGDADSIAGILLLIKTTFPANKYILFTYNHSNFFGALSNDIQVMSSLVALLKMSAKAKFLDYIKENKKAEIKEWWGYEELKNNDALLVDKLLKEYDFTKNANIDMLTNSEFANAIFKAFGLNRNENECGLIEAVFFNSCYTATLDNLYLYSGKVKYIMAAEGEIYVKSFDISRIVHAFAQNAEDTRVAMEIIMKNFYSDFNKLNGKEITDEQCSKMVVGAFDLTNNLGHRLLDQLNKVVLALIHNKDIAIPLIKEKIERPEWADCYWIYNDESPEERHKKYEDTMTFSIDAIAFFESICNDERTAPLKDLRLWTLELLGTLKSAIVGNVFKGENIAINMEDMHKKGFQGISIFFPSFVEKVGEKKKAQLSNSYSFYSPYRNQFAKDSYWPIFLEVYEKEKNKEPQFTKDC